MPDGAACIARLVTIFFFFFQAEDGIRDKLVTGVQTCALPIFASPTYERWGTFEPRPMRDFFISTKLPTFAPGPTWQSGRRWQNGPSWAPSSTVASVRTQ